MNREVLSIDAIARMVKPLARKYGAQSVYLFGSYARGEAEPESDLDFLVIGGEGFRLTHIFALAEDLRRATDKPVDMFEIHELNAGSEFYQAIMRERVRVA